VTLVRTLADLGPDLILAPERFHAQAMRTGGVPLVDLVQERVEHVRALDTVGAIVLDTTHAKDGILDVEGARRSGRAASAKKRVHRGDVLISRLRPYLRQVALAHEAAFTAWDATTVVCSTEFYVLSPRGRASPPVGDREARRSPGGKLDLAFLIPFFLSRPVQALLAAAQEGGHHPRVPRETLLGLSVPRGLVDARARTSRRIRATLGALYAAVDAYADAVNGAPTTI
jgi:hypothetical protein